MSRVAAIDVGSNTVLMRIAAPGVVLADRAVITGLGRGLARNGALDDAAIERTVVALTRFAEEARTLGASIRCVGTSALRDAPDRARFVEAARKRAGVDVEVISGEREAELAFLGATDGLPITRGALITVVDVGGGSTEIAVGEAGVAIGRGVSVDVGSVRLLPLVPSDPPTALELAALHAAIDTALDAASPPFAVGTPLVALAGTALTVGAIALSRSHDDLGALHGSRLDVRQIAGVAEEMGRRTLAARAADPSVAPERADVILPGSAILAAVVARSGATEVLLSDGGVRVGVLRESLDGSPISG